MARSDGDGASAAPESRMSNRSGGQAENLVNGRGDSRNRRLDGVHQTDTAEQFWTLVSLQGALMLLLLAVLIGLELLTPEVYFTLSFLGLLALRTVFVPTDDPPQWWRRLNWAVRIGFLVLGYIVVQRALELL